MAKSYRNVNIRVTAENETEREGLVLYTLTDIENNLKDWSESAGITYWIIEHPADDEVSKTHFHIVIKFRSPMPGETIKNRFPYGFIEKTRVLRASIQYLIHFNDSSKVQYSWDDIKTNCQDMTPYKVQSSSQQEVTIQGIIDAIKAGEIKEYDQFDKIPNEIWSKYRSRIENSLIFERERIYMNKNRDISVIFMSGPTGTGKTTFAKNYCETVHKRPCISSASNDPLQDYKGEEVLIMDDMRDDVYKFHDLLKFLDNHTRSSGKSRYHNKSFIGDTIIITSSKPIIDWYFSAEKVTPEDKRQLYRRVKSWYKFSEDKIDAYEYDDILHHYVFAGSAPNYITMSKQQRIATTLKVFDAMGIEFTSADMAKLETGLNDMTDEEWRNGLNTSSIPEATEEEKKAQAEYEKSKPEPNWKKIKECRIG